ncbi:MAG: oligoendopeptidase F [Nanohaloarchaea archaeon SW_7_43_1]|nr:MAG: oligoendopeptidase F [Nanohaloarchaea archaeon SW_7_43_1]
MVRSRDEIDSRYKWGVDEVYSIGELDQEIDDVRSLLEDVKDFSGGLSREENLEEFLDKYSRMERKLSTLSRYASMKSDEDTRDQEARALKSKVSSLSSKVSEETSFVKLEIQGIGKEKVEDMIESNDKIAERDYYLREFTRLKPYTRSLEVEKTVSSLSEVLDASSETYSMLSNADLTFPEINRDGEKTRITQANFTRLLKDGDENFREEVYESYYETLEGYENTIGTTFSKEVRTNIKMAEIRNYNSAREAALKPDNIPLDVYDNLVETVEDNLDVLHDHMKLKQEARNLDSVKMHDLYLPIPESNSPEVSYEKAKEYILEALQPLGERYVEKLREGLENRWVDVYETDGKRSGAYSGGSYDTRPFILMNYQKDIDSMYTLAHELGHSMHSELTSKNQPYLHSNYKIFVAEVASTVNEVLLTEYLLENIDDQEFGKHVLSHALENFRSTLFRQTMFADFEKKIHDKAESGEPMTAERASEIYADLKSDFYRPVEMDEHIRNEWMRIPHFYYNFYVFQYATGISAANQIAEIIQDEEPENYLKFLKSGGSAPPLELLRKAGVDMESKEPVETAIEHYSKRIEQMREQL